MARIGIFFGTDSGSTRLVAKKIAKQIKERLGDGVAAKPVNVNRATPEDLCGYQALILGTPTYGDGVLPGVANGTEDASWLEFLPGLMGRDFRGVRIALYGLGDQETYPRHFCDAMAELHGFFAATGAELVGGCPSEGYAFTRSKAVVEGRFIGLALDQHLQHLLTDERIAAWLDAVLPLLLAASPAASEVDEPLAAVG